MRNLRLLMAVVVFAAGVAFGQVTAQDFDALLEQGKQAYEENNYVELEKVFRQLIKLRPDDAELYAALGENFL